MTESQDITRTPLGASVSVYDGVVAVFAIVGGSVALLAGIAVSIALLMSVLSRAGLDLPGSLGQAAWAGYLGAWLAAFTFTPFGAVSGAVAGGRRGRLAGRLGLAWCAALVVMAVGPLLFGEPISGVGEVAFFVCAVLAMAALPSAIGVLALTAGLARLPRVRAAAVAE